LPPCRINKFFTNQGICSRREADRAIETGRVTINGKLAHLGGQVVSGDRIALDGLEISWGNPAVYIKFHKPVGITTTSEPGVAGNIIACIGHQERIFPIGRLDKDSSGLILLTNDGEIVNRLLRAEFGHEREYVVRVDRNLTQEFLKKMAQGVVILNRPTRPCRIMPMGPRRFKIVLTEGRNRQIRRMCTTLGYRVVSLNRTRIMDITLGNLPEGQWRNLTKIELTHLMEKLYEQGLALAFCLVPCTSLLLH